MCGIVGLWGNYSPDDLNAALRSLSHRGPDDEGTAEPVPGLKLGQRRLSIIDVSRAGHQPMLAQVAPVTIVYNGEVYNFPEIRSELESRGYRFRGTSDTEVILNAYVEFGEAILERLNGIFALAIWDARSETLLVARDPMGAKPLYYCNGVRGFAFASEIKALFAARVVQPQVKPTAVLSHLVYLWSPGEETIAEGVLKLRPGHAMVLDRSARVTRSWCYADPTKPTTFTKSSAEDIASGLADVVRRAVKRQIVSDVPLGAFLSGGLDSSSIVAFAREFTGCHRLQCFTIEPLDASSGADGFADDLPYARRVAAHLGVDLHTVSVGPEMADRLPEMVYQLDEPTADPAALNTLYISELAREHGIKVLLSGTGGDDIFTGYRRHYAVQQERWWRGWPLPLRSALRRCAGALPPNSASARRIRKAFQYADHPDSERLISYFFWMHPAAAHDLLTEHMRASVGSFQYVFEAPLATLSRLTDRLPPLQRMLYLESKHFLADHNLNYSDKMGMATSVEIRVPLIDLEVVAYASRIPLEMRQHGRVGKWIFKRAMEPFLPKDVIYRPKTGFGLPLREWFKGRLRPLVQDVFSSSSLATRGLFDGQRLQLLLRQHESGVVDASYNILAVVCIELWCREFVDRAW